MSTFAELHRGFQPRELIAQGNTQDALECVPRGGFRFISSANGQYTATGDRPLQELIREPHMTGPSRELALTRRGTWASALFLYQPPRFGFAPGEQRFLLAAQLGGTDEDLADELGISLSAINKAWHSNYDRVCAHDPELVPATTFSEEGAAGRGKTKKQRLLAYLRDHPEELRPAAA
jgi:hypothetical protein